MTTELQSIHAATSLTTHEHIGFELGWDYAHHRVALPAPYAQEASPLRDGLRAGEATFGLRTLAVAQWRVFLGIRCRQAHAVVRVVPAELEAELLVRTQRARCVDEAELSFQVDQRVHGLLQ